LIVDLGKSALAKGSPFVHAIAPAIAAAFRAAQIRQRILLRSSEINCRTKPKQSSAGSDPNLDSSYSS
jgi:hypothetical protein